MPKIVDLFAGCGGLSLGFQYAGFDIIGAFEFWNVAADCYEKNFSHPVYREDLSDVQLAVEKIRAMNPDIIIGGPPCQDFSHAGKRVENERASLTESFSRIVDSIRPRWFVMENVDRAKKSNAYAVARDTFKKAGYGLTEIVIDASLYGVPQKRKRFFCIGSLGQEDNFLDEYILKKQSTEATTLRDYFGASLDFEYYYRHPRNYSRRGVYSIDEPAPTMRGVNRPVPKGYLGHPNDPCQLNDSIRALTTLERALIQTFPADFHWTGSKTDMEQMIGNAVPVKLAEFVGKSLQHHISECAPHAEITDEKIDFLGFLTWLQANGSLSERTKRDTLSRLKRADNICSLPQNPDSLYIFNLEQTNGYRSLTQSVRSQVKRAVSLYSAYRANVHV
ncbi:MAG: DNA cytosine methyltransferase [Eubacteriaceae bacterium]|nr:DNA cytosine methyltransferase [Eubacteriaceae bacterium]